MTQREISTPPSGAPPQQGIAILALVIFFSLAGVLASVMITGLLRDSWQMQAAAEDYQQSRWQLRDGLHTALLADWFAWQQGMPAAPALTDAAQVHSAMVTPADSGWQALRIHSHQGLSLGQTVSWQPLMPGWPEALAVTPQGSLMPGDTSWQPDTENDQRLMARLFGPAPRIRTVLDRAQRVQESCRELTTAGGVMLVRGDCVLTAGPAAQPLLLVVEGGSVALAAGSQHRGLLVLLADPQRPGFVPRLTGPGLWSGALLSEVPVAAEQVVQTLRADAEALQQLGTQPALYRLWQIAGGGYEE